ncbi:MAG: YceI family protein [Myxococcota bacterium]
MTRAARFLVITAAGTLSMAVTALPAAAQGFFGRAGPVSIEIGDAPAASQITFLCTAPMEQTRGTASHIKGSLRLADGANLAGTTGKITVPIASMTTGSDTRDVHMRGPEWLNGDGFPLISFEIEKLDGVTTEGSTAKATTAGTFSLNGVSKRLAIPVNIVFNPKNQAIKITAKFSILLKDFNIKGKRGIIGKQVGESVELEAVFYGLAR